MVFNNLQPKCSQIPSETVHVPGSERQINPHENPELVELAPSEVGQSHSGVNDSPTVEQEPPLIHPQSDTQLRRSIRTRQRPNYLSEYICY